MSFALVYIPYSFYYGIYSQHEYDNDIFSQLMIRWYQTVYFPKTALYLFVNILFICITDHGMFLLSWIQLEHVSEWNIQLVM